MNDPEKISKVRTRFAPSPTGYLHVGGLRTALFAYLFAKHNGGDFILRVEDTDQARFVEGAIEKICAILDDLGLHYDEGVVVRDGVIADRGEHGPYLQSKRKDLYKKYGEQLVAEKHAYYCFCDEKRLEELRKEQEALKKPTQYDRKCRNLDPAEIEANLAAGKPHVIRQAMPLDGQTVVHDLVYKDIVIDNLTLDDQILMKSDGFPTYHLAVVIDDHLMEISHVIRGEEWIPSTPKHILLFQAFGWKVPAFAHLPLLLNKDHTKLSKRQGDVAVEDYLAKGYLKEALINFVALLGWNPKTEQEIFSLDDLVKQFDFSKVNKSGAVFDVEKLDWINGLYIRATPAETLVAMTLPFLSVAGLIEKTDSKTYRAKNGKTVSAEYIGAVLGVEKERLKKLSEIGERVAYFFDHPAYNPQILIWRKSSLADTKNNLKNLLEHLQEFGDEEFASVPAIEAKVKEFIAAKGLDNGSVLWPLRVALSGMEASPGPFEIMRVLFLGFGKHEIFSRIEHALKALE